MNPRSDLDYFACFTGQRGAVSRREQQRLRRSTVLVAGGGGVGTIVTSALAATGVGTVVVVDPQRLEVADFNRHLHARASDLGRPKAVVLARAFSGRPHLTVVPIVTKAEGRTLEAHLGPVDAVVTASNTVSSRVAMARLAIRRRVPLVAAAVDDARERTGGLVAVWHPAARHLACPACFLRPGSGLRRGEALLPTVVTMIGALAAHQVVRFLAGRATNPEPNVFDIDLGRGLIEPLTVRRRRGCPVCRRHTPRPKEPRS